MEVEVRIQERFRILADSSPVALWIAAPNAKCYFFNQFWLTFTGRTMDQEIGDGWAEGVHAMDFQHCMDTFLTAFNRREQFRMEYRLRRADGEYRWILDHGVPFFEADGKFAGYVGSCVDITERKDVESSLRDRVRKRTAELEVAEKQLRTTNEELEERVRLRTADLERSLAEKEVMLREIHHRVKNNLQAISSLLRMESRYAKEPGDAHLFREVQGRIQSMALVHEQLYSSQDKTHIDFGEYAGTLARTLFESYAPRRSRVRLDIQQDSVHLPLQQAIPLGMILNELISNCLKHAFPENRDGTIRVALKAANENRHVLTVKDDGVGLRDDSMDAEATALGIRLVRILVGQLRGELNFHNHNGAEFTIDFPANPENDTYE